MGSLFDRVTEFNDDVFRNIAQRHIEPVDPFDDLGQGDDGLAAVADKAEQRVRQHRGHGAPGVIEPVPYPLNVIAVPFERDTIFATRYSDGSFAVWYGSLDPETTVFETAYHMIRVELAVEGIAEPIIRERVVYQVHCEALLIDLRDKRESFPQLVSEDCSVTHPIGARLKREGHPGVLTPSARCPGDNIAAFNRAILSHPRPHSNLAYVFDPEQFTVTINGLHQSKEITIPGDRWY